MITAIPDIISGPKIILLPSRVQSHRSWLGHTYQSSLGPGASQGSYMLTATEVCLCMSALVKDQGIWASLQHIQWTARHCWQSVMPSMPSSGPVACILRQLHVTVL